MGNKKLATNPTVFSLFYVLHILSPILAVCECNTTPNTHTHISSYDLKFCIISGKRDRKKNPNSRDKDRNLLQIDL